MEEREAGRLQGMTALRSLVEENNVLRRRMDLLQGPDRALATMYLEYGASFRQIASLTGISEVTVARRLDRIVRRLQRWGKICAARQRGMGRTEERIAREYLVRGRSQRAVAARLGCTRYAVQKALRAIVDMSGCRKTRNRDTRPPRSCAHDSIY